MHARAAPLLSQSYSAGTQGERASEDRWADLYIAELRLDLMLAPHIVVPDTHLFDGRLFLRWSPAELMEILNPGGNTLPIVIATRELDAPQRRTISTALRASFFSPEGRIRAWQRNVVADPEARANLSAVLRDCPSTVLERTLRSAGTVPDGLADFLKDRLHESGHPDDQLVETLRNRWQEWIQAEEDTLVATQPYDPKSYRLHDELSRDRLTDRDIETYVARTLRDEVVRNVRLGHQDMETFGVLFESANGADLSPQEALELQTVRSWYRILRVRALARQHRCHGVRALQPDIDLGTRFDAGMTRLEQEAGSLANVVLLPDSFLAGLAQAPSGEWRDFLASSKTTRGKWLTDASDIDSLRKTVDTLLAKVPSIATTPSPSNWRSMFKIVSAAVGATTVPAALGRSVGALAVTGSGAFLAALATEAKERAKESAMTSGVVSRTVVEYLAVKAKPRQ